MQATKRYGLVLAIIICSLLIYGGVNWIYRLDDNHDAQSFFHEAKHETYRVKKGTHADHVLQQLRDFTEDDLVEATSDEVISPSQRRDARKRIYKNRKCRMETCFDFTLCQQHGFRIYVYPDTDDKMSNNYKNILTTLRGSHYYTENPEEACLFVLAYDTLDRDPLSADYIHNLDSKILRLKHWNNGRNHVVFNLYSGTYPKYLEDLGFNFGEAIIAKASFSDNYYRAGFDVSLPLFAKSHPLKKGESGFVKSNYFPPRRKYLMSFKGKRYTYGIGSATRNSLFHIHNGDDIIMLTTCKHGKHWEQYKDQRCEIDNEEYDKWDYQSLLHNSSFCLTPRGRRLGSFRFLESLQSGCIPVVLANGWMLPFAEVIDWKTAALEWEERLLLQVPSVIREISDDQILSMQQQSQFLWERYFASIEVILQTSFQIIQDRIFKEHSRDLMMWNNQPGSLFYLPNYSYSLQKYPSYNSLIGIEAPEKFTAVIQAVLPIIGSSSPITKLIKTLTKTVSCEQIVIVWHCIKPPPAQSRLQELVAKDNIRNIQIIIINDNPKKMSRRFYPFSQIKYDAILHLDDDAILCDQEIDFAFEVWRTFPDRIVGFPARNHLWDERKSRWAYTSKWSNWYSIVLTGAAFAHKYYSHLYTEWLPIEAKTLVDSLSNCEDLLMNMLVSHVTRLPPIKVTQRKQYKDSSAATKFSLEEGGVVPQWSNPQHFSERQRCMTSFVDLFGYMPLKWSQTRFDPTFFKDNVSVKRKRYPKIETCSIND